MQKRFVQPGLQQLRTGILVGLLACGLAAFGAAPTNDLCSGAVTVPTAGPFPYLAPIVDVDGAGTVGDPQPPACSPVVSRSVWYRFQPAATATYSLSVSKDTLTTVKDTVMAVYSSPSDCAGPMTEIDCSDDEVNGLRSALILPLQAGIQYFVVVWIYRTDPPVAGETSVQLRVDRPLPPPNDFCQTAEFLPAAGPFPHLTALADITFASTDADPPVPTCQTNLSRSLWYKFTPAATSAYRFSTCDDTRTTVHDTVLGVYISGGDCSGPFTQVACSDDDCSVRSVLETTLTAGTTYYIVAWEFDLEPAVPGQTLMQLRVSVPPPLFTSSGWLPNGRLLLGFTALPGQPYEIQGATNLTNWTRLGDAETVGDGLFQFTVTNASLPSRFFRVRSP